MRYLFNLVKNFSPSCLFLSETKGNYWKLAHWVNKLGYDNVKVVEPRGLSGGLLLIWREDCNIRVEWQQENAICYTICDADKKDVWRMYGCYGPPSFSGKRRFWADLSA